MHRLLAGIFVFALLLPAVARAETKGEVESIGFGAYFRPNCHIPMLVRVQADKSGTYQIRVTQKDMDADQQIFTQTVSLTGSEEGKPIEQRFWLYFVPQPNEGGLAAGSLRDLQQQLKVTLCDEKGRVVCPLPVTGSIMTTEGGGGGTGSAFRGTRVVLAVSDTSAQPVWRDYQDALGLTEDILFLPAQSRDLPEDVRGYEMVDAIVWLNAAPPDPSKAADEKRYNALRQYIRGGGHLVVCQPAQREATVNFDDILPVTVTEISPRDTLEPLRTLATKELTAQREAEKRGERTIGGLPAAEPLEERGPGIDDWERPRGPFMYAKAELKKNAIAPVMMNWDADGKEQTPWLARSGYGCGAVTWVAHDLSDPAITGRAKAGWPFVWEKVLDYKNDPLLVTARTTSEMKRPYEPGATVDVGYALLGGMQLTSKAQALVSIAVVFFIAYWVIAGPGVYFYLLTKSRPQFSWFMFALAGLAATLLTVLVVKLVVRGPAEISHVTVVRGAGNNPMIEESRFGLYIPRDGEQEISLPDVSPKEVSYITAYPMHPAHSKGDIEFPAQMPYLVPIRDANAEEPPTISVPFRSTLKQFQVRRVGPAGGKIEGSAKLDEGAAGMSLSGIVTNGTGVKLKNVYFAFYDPRREDDVIFFLSSWDKSQSVELTEFDRSTKTINVRSEAGNFFGYPEEGETGRIKLRGEMGKPGVENGWSRYWYADLRSRNNFDNRPIDDMGTRVPKSIPMLSLFERLPPMKNLGGPSQPNRVDIIRRGGRYMDISHAVAAGQLVILAEADTKEPLPYPIDVDGSKVPGSGRIFYQFVVPIERVRDANAPATQSTTTQPTALKQTRGWRMENRG